MKKRIRVKKRPSVAICYHQIPPDSEDVYYSQEHVVTDSQTLDTVNYVKKVLVRRGYKVKTIPLSPNDLSGLKNLKIQFIFNLVDSKEMEIQMAKILEKLHIPYSGSGSDAIYTSNNKIRTKSIFQKAKIPVAPYRIIQFSDKITRSMLPSKFPVILKPAFEHCSLGITSNSVITNFNQFKIQLKKLRKKFRQTLICEQFIRGREYQILVLERPTDTISFPIAEMKFKNKTRNKWNIYGYVEKWNQNSRLFNSVTFVSPALHLDPKIEYQIRRDAIRAFYALNFKDYARFDIRFNPKTREWYFLEGNANPGLSSSPEDSITASITASDLTLDDFIVQIVKNYII